MPRLIIDGRQVEAPTGATVLEAARTLGIPIPTLCHLDGYEPFTSCMVCVVQDKATAKMIPSCAARAADGMVVETDNAAVRDARRVALELLLSDHVGDCAAPCQRVCPAHLDIPLMLRQIAAGDHHAAIATAKLTIPFPATLGRICPAPCEKGCRRAQHDDPVTICLLKRFVGDAELEAKHPFVLARAPASGKRVAVVGAGPTGLTAAFYLLQHGHACSVFDAQDKPGGGLRSIPAGRLPHHVLDTEIDVVRKLGAELHAKTRLGRDIALADLHRLFNAVIIATGKPDRETAYALGIANGATLSANPHSGATDTHGLFAGGDCVSEHRMAVRSVGAGRILAASVHQYLSDTPVTGLHHRFDSVLGKLHPDELARFLQLANSEPGRHRASDGPRGFTDAEARAEAARCLHCDCRKRDGCRLRDYATEYDARQRRYVSEERQPFLLIRQHDRVIFEPAKCIKCGLCVQITKRAGEKLGLTFIGRGFDVRVGVPLDESMADALTTTAEACVEACPTGALCGAPCVSALVR